MLDSEKKTFEGENFWEFRAFVAIHVFSMKKFFSPICKSFLPRSFPLYGVMVEAGNNGMHTANTQRS